MSSFQRRLAAFVAAIAVAPWPAVSVAEADAREVAAPEVVTAVEQAQPTSTVQKQNSTGQSFSIIGREVHHPKMVMTLPDAQGKAVSFGNVQVFDGSALDFALRPTDDGFQAFFVLSSSSVKKNATFRFPGLTLEKTANGEIIIRKNGKYGVPVGLIEKPWAKDAKGRQLDTRYEVEGDKLIQHVSTDSKTSFPVVADPRVRYSWYGYSVDFTRHETNLIGAGSAGCAVVAASFPDVTISKVIAISCGVLAVVANYALNEGKCLSFKYFLGGSVFPWIAPCYA